MTSYPLAGVPGISEVIVEILEAEDPRIARMKYPGVTLAELRTFLGGDEGGWRSGVTGERYHVSLAPYLATDTPTKRYFIRGRFTPRQPIEPAHREQIAAYVRDDSWKR